MRDGDPDGGGDDSDGDAVRHAVEVSAGEVDDDVAPDHGEADQRVQQHEDEEHRGGGLQLRPQQHRVDVVPKQSQLILTSSFLSPSSSPHVVHAEEQQQPGHEHAGGLHQEVRRPHALAGGGQGDREALAADVT